MDVNNKGFPNETQNRKHSILKIVYMLAIMLMATSGFVLLSNVTDVQAWTGNHTHDFSGGCPGQTVRCAIWNSTGKKHCEATGTGTGSHNWGKYVSDGNGTCQVKGTKTKTCSSCGATYTKACTNYADCSYTYDSQGSTGHIKKCKWCGNPGTTESHDINPSTNKCNNCEYTKPTASDNGCCTTGICYVNNNGKTGDARDYGYCGCGAGRVGTSCDWSVSYTLSSNNGSEYATFYFSGCHGHSCTGSDSGAIKLTKATLASDKISEVIDEFAETAKQKASWTVDGKEYYHSPCANVSVTKYTASYNFSCRTCGGSGHNAAYLKYLTSNPGPLLTAWQEYGNYRYKSGWQHNSEWRRFCGYCNTKYWSENRLQNCVKGYSQIAGNDSKHKATCSLCNHSANENHEWTSVSQTAHTTTKVCGLCGYVYSKTTPHTFDKYTSNNNGTHYQKCTTLGCDYKTANENCTNTKASLSGSGSWSDYSSTEHRRGGTQYYNPCPKCQWTKPGTPEYEYKPHDKNALTVATAWSQSDTEHWHTSTKKCSVCYHQFSDVGANQNQAPHDWGSPYDYTNWSGVTSGTDAPARKRNYKKKCNTCNYVKTFEETCNHTFGAWEYKKVDGTATSWVVATASTADTSSTRNKRRVCSYCNYIQTGTDTCKHDGSTNASWKYGAWEYKKADGTITSWVTGTSSTADTPSTRDKRRVCAGCNYINLGTNTCKHDGNTDGLKYSNWTPTAPGTWNEGEAKSTRPQTRTCGCGYTQKGTETCNHNGTPSGSHIVYDKITNNDVKHTKRCSYCTWSKLDNHIWKDSSTNNGWKQGDTSNHTRECSLCGYIEIKPHNWGDWVDINNDTVHQSTCADCKRTKTEAHLFSNVPTYDNYDTGYHYDKCQTKNASGVLTCNHITKGQHTLSDWLNNNPGDNGQVLSAPTGTHTHWCTFVNTSGKQCPYTRTENHNWIKVATDKPGFSKYQCSSTGCGAIQYTTNYYTVKFLPNGGSPNTIAEQTVTYTAGIALTEMTRTGYTFKGWQKYSGADSNNNTNTDPLVNGNTEYFRFATNMLAGYNDNNMVVTLIAIWQHDHPTDTVEKVSITGGVSANASNPSGIGTAYYCNPKSTYTVTQRTVNNTSPYYVSSNGIEVIGASSGITLENATDFADSQTVAGEFIVHTLTSNATIKSTNNDGVIKLQPYSIRTCNWADTTRSCTTCKNVRTNGNQTALMFDGNAPLEDTINPLIAEWESPTGIAYHYEQLNGRTLTIKATDIIGTYYSGLDASVCSIVLEGSDGSTRTLSKTPTTDIYGRITDYTFETFTIDETTPFFADGFKITWNFTDRVGNNSPTSKGSYKFNGFTVGITEFGSYTYQTETSAFTKGEAVYVKIKTTGYTDALNIKVPYDNVQYVYYTDKTDAFVLENAHTENLVTNASNTIDIMSYKNSGGVNRPGYINIDATFGDDKPEHEFYFIFIIPEDSTNTTGTVTVTGTKKALGTTMTKTDSRNFTIDTSTYITEGLHTIIRRTN